MRQIQFALLACLCASPTLQGAYTLSRAEVTPDPRYATSNFSALWPHISLEEAKRLLAQPGVVFVDGRSYAEWESSHIPGSIPLPGGEFDKRYAMHKSKLRKAKVIVSYCHGEHCGLADYLAQLLSDKGHRNLAVFWGGFPAWEKAKLPLEGNNKSQKPPKKTAP